MHVCVCAYCVYVSVCGSVSAVCGGEENQLSSAIAKWHRIVGNDEFSSGHHRPAAVSNGKIWILSSVHLYELSSQAQYSVNG